MCIVNMKIFVVATFVLFFIHLAVSSHWGGTIVFEDNFDRKALDLDKWDYLEGCDERNGTGDLQCFTKENVAVRNGVLVITAKNQQKDGKQYTSGGIRQKGLGFMNATYVVRARLARGDLLWSTLRLINTYSIDRYDEINVLEYASRAPDFWKWKTSICYGSPSNISEQGVSVTNYFGPDFSSDFGEYAVEWLPQEMTWYINKQGNQKHYSPFPQDPLQFVLNLEIGHELFKEFPPINSKTWAKPTMEIDWVRVYQN